MSFPTRTPLVPLPEYIRSAYPIGGARADTTPVVDFPNHAGYVPAATRDALTALHRAVMDAGGDFRVTDCRRSVTTQLNARKRYEHWLSAGSPARGTAGFDAETMKDSYVSKPGFSFHNAGRAIDIDIARLAFPMTSASQQLDTLWRLARPLDWRPIIADPREHASEAWHFDCMGPWWAVYQRLGYASAAMGATLDIGVRCFGRDSERTVQSQLQRAGYNVGPIDGLLGPVSRAGLRAAGIEPTTVRTHMPDLYALPDSTAMVWDGGYRRH